MKEIGYVGIFLGAVGALLAIFITELVRNAFRTRLIAFKASAYLATTLNSIVENKTFLDAATIAKTWSDERTKLMQSFGRGKLTADNSSALTALDKKYRDAFSAAFKDEEAVARMIASFVGHTETPTVMAAYDALLLRSEEDLRNNISWLSDEDAAYLGWVAAHHTVTVRQKLMQVTAFTGLLLAHAREKTMDAKAAATIMESLFNALIDGLRAFFPLRERVEHIRKMNLLELILLKLRD